MSFDFTIGGAAATSYLSKEDAKDYFKYRLHSELWGPFADKKAALMTATRLLDQWVRWYGIKTAESQSLDWPRYGVVDKDGYSVPDDIIPQAIKNAACEMAYAMLEDDLTVTNAMAGLKSIKVGSLAIVADRFDRASTIPEAVWKAVGCYGVQPANGQVPLVRV